MGRKCVVHNCLSDERRPEDEGVTFHRIPFQSIEIRTKWFELCRIPTDRLHHKNLHVCSRHFLRADFGNFKGTKYVLKTNVAPSVFPWDKSRLVAIRREESRALVAAAAAHTHKSDEHVGQKRSGPTIDDDDKLTVKRRKDDEPLGDIKEEGEDEVAPSSDENTLANRIKTNVDDVVKSVVEKSVIEAVVDKIMDDLVNIEVEKNRNNTMIRSGPESIQNPIMKTSAVRKKARRFRSAIRKSSSSRRKKPKTTERRSVKYDANGRMIFELNQRIEALDFNSVWYPARIIEEDYEENEVLVHFEKYSSKYDEWIPMDSARLRPWRSRRISLEKKNRNSGNVEQYLVGERCFASWSDLRKFPATVTKQLPNDMYEVLFDDGFVKNVKEHKLCKLDAVPLECSPLFDPVRGTKEERREKKRKFSGNIAQLFGRKSRSDSSDNVSKDTITPPPPSSITPTSQLLEETPPPPPDDHLDENDDDNEDADILDENPHIYEPWVPDWRDGMPVGHESTMISVEGDRKSIIVDDPRLPPGWIKHLSRRCTGMSAGKWDSIILSPDGKRLRSRAEVKQYLRDTKLMKYNWSQFDFSIHRVRTKPRKEPKRRHNKSISSSANFRRRRYSSSRRAKKLVVELEKMQPNVTTDENSTINTTIDGNQKMLLTEGASDTSDTGGGLKIPLEDGGFHCPIEGCGKLFRKANLAQMHIKHYHPEYTKLLGTTPNVADLAYARTIADIPRDVVTSSSSSSKHMTGDHRHSSPSRHHRPLPSPPHKTTPKDSEIIRLLNTKRDAPSEVRTGPGGIKTLLPITRRQSPSLPPPPGDLSPRKQTGICHPNVIIEGGQVIKIVRMKQEEIINCTCGYTEEDGLMIQCDLCLCWQHAFCNNIERESQVPEKYICYICQNPYRQRESRRFYHDQDWLKHGVLPVGAYHTKYDAQLSKRYYTLKKSHDISGGLMELADYVHSLRIKLRIAEAKDHPKLYLWSKLWDKINVKEECADVTTTPTKMSQDGQLSNDTSTTTNPSLLLNALQNGDNNNSITTTDRPMKSDENKSSGPIIPQPEAAIDTADCRLNLLEHISNAQDCVEQRLSAYEKQLDDLESDFFEENDENYPRTRQTLKMLLKDLNTLQDLSQMV